MKGLIALDIDGTLTNERREIPSDVIKFLHRCYARGWGISFITGRTYSFAQNLLEKFSMPLMLGLQNGAELLDFPSKKLLAQSFIEHKLVLELQEVFKEHQEDFLIYSGFEKGDFCYYRPERFEKRYHEYFQVMKRFASSEWVPLDSFEGIEQKSFPLIKGMGKRSNLKKIQEKLADIEELSTSLIVDAIDENLNLLMVSSKEANKGSAAKKLVASRGASLPIIAAGDEENDIEMLKVADVSIAMATGSDKLKECADIIAPPSTELGIIPALKEAIYSLEEDR